MEKKLQKIPVVAVVGPTASGKTALAVEIALHTGGEVISADSMQVYRGMDIATAKPSEEERKGISHHLIDFLDIRTPFSVADYAALAHEAIREVWERGHLPILAGGTGLYVDAVLDDLRFTEIKSDAKLREELTKYAEDKGPSALLEMLREADPETADALHENNRGRIIRAIEVYRLTGIPMSEHRRRSRRESRYSALKIGLNYRERRVLYERIDRRVDEMLKNGLLEEAERFRCKYGCYTSAQAIGYKELAGYFEGTLSLDESVENLKRETRRYAKRQLTWFRREPDIHWFYPDESDFFELQKNILLLVDNFTKMWYD